MNKKIIYTIPILIFAFISTELMLNTLLAGYGKAGYSILWLILPATIIFGLTILVTARYSIPSLLLKKRYGAFFILSFAISYLVMCLFLEIENLGLSHVGLPPRVTDMGCWSIYVERLGNSIMMTTILIGIGMFSLWDEWLLQVSKEKRLTEALRDYIDVVRSRLDRNTIMEGIGSIAEALRKSPDMAAEAIGRLSDYLRFQLYELPVPPGADTEAPDTRFDSFASFIAGKRLGPLRVFIFEFLLIIISIDGLFEAPDRPLPFAEHYIAPLAIFLYLNFLALLNRFWLFRRFKRHHSYWRYLAEAALIVGLPVLLLFFFSMANPEPAAGGSEDSPLILILAIVGGLCAMIMFSVGITAFFLLQHWIRKQQNVAMLAAETSRQEYLFLKAQINPHFLFNVLNNITETAYDDTAQAILMVEELRRLMVFQFDEASMEYVFPSREIQFLESYLRLEASRHADLSFSISKDESIDRFPIPTLLLIPIVENAVKHSAGVEGQRHIDIRIKSCEATFLFICSNNFTEMQDSGISAGGIGLANLQRRLRLLYGRADKLSVDSSYGIFTVTLRLPAS